MKVVVKHYHAATDSWHQGILTCLDKEENIERAIERLKRTAYYDPK